VIGQFRPERYFMKNKVKTKVDLSDHEHEGYAWWEYDYQNIPLCKVCDSCVDAKLATYRPEILRGYDQNDVNEPIEPTDADW